MYRPTVRYPDVFKDYVDALFSKTKLDRNQIFRLALFAAAHSREFHAILKKYSFGDVPLPPPEWTLNDDACWKGNHYSGSAYKRVQMKQMPPAAPEPEKVLHFKESGGIKITLS